jgi:hypothetical protein
MLFAVSSKPLFKVMTNLYHNDNSAFERVHSEHDDLESAKLEADKILPHQRWARVVEFSHNRIRHLYTARKSNA